MELNDACLSTLPPNDRDSFAEAQRYYDDTFANCNRQAPLSVAARYELAGFPDFDIVDEPILSPTLEVLGGARPAYEARWQSYLDGNASLMDAAFGLLQDVLESVGE